MWYLITAVAPILWGTSYVLMESGLDNGLPLWNAFFRALPAGLILLAIRPMAFKARPLGYASLLGFLNIGVFFVCMFIATYRIPGSLVATLGATMPLQVMIIRRVLYGVEPTLGQVVAGAFGLLGVYLLLSGSPIQLDIVGVVVAFIGMFSMSLATVLMQHHGMTDNVIGFMGVQLVAGALCILPAAYFIEGTLPAYGATEMITLSWLSIVNTALGYLIWLFGIRKIGVFNASLLTLVNPIVAVLLGVMLMQDPLSLLQLFAIAIILGSVSLPNVGGALQKWFKTTVLRRSECEAS